MSVEVPSNNITLVAKQSPNDSRIGLKEPQTARGTNDRARKNKLIAQPMHSWNATLVLLLSGY